MLVNKWKTKERHTGNPDITVGSVSWDKCFVCPLGSKSKNGVKHWGNKELCVDPYFFVYLSSVYEWKGRFESFEIHESTKQDCTVSPVLYDVNTNGAMRNNSKVDDIGTNVFRLSLFGIKCNC